MFFKYLYTQLYKPFYLKKKLNKKNKSNFTDQIYHWCELSLSPSFEKPPHAHTERVSISREDYVVSKFTLQYKLDWDGMGNYNFHVFLSLELL